MKLAFHAVRADGRSIRLQHRKDEIPIMVVAGPPDDLNDLRAMLRHVHELLEAGLGG